MRSLSVSHTAARTSLAAALAVIIVAGMGGPASAAAREVTVDYSFSAPEVTEVFLDGRRYDRLVMPACPNGGNVGEPSLPACGARVLLPFGTEVTGVEVAAGAKVPLGSGYFVDPVPAPVRLSDLGQSHVPPTPDPVIYGSNQPFPGTRFEEIGTYGFRGYRILTLKLHPVEYVPVSGELYYYPELTVKVRTRPARGADPLFRGLVDDGLQVQGKVDNPEMSRTYRASQARGERSYQLLILTTSNLVGAFEPLRDYHNAHGIPTEIHTTDDVGSNDPVVVREYIRDRYLNDGIEYVIIGGDDDVVPAKDLYVDGENTMPGDIFFSCLDGSWNSDGDGRWGEPNDGEGGGDVDLVAEVYVGRACAGNTTEAQRFVTKTLWYLNGGHGSPENVLLVGEYLGFGGIADWGGNYLDELIDGSSEHGYTTVGFPSDLYNIQTLYERDGAWGKWDLIDKLDEGIHMLNHLGHGSPDYAMHLYNSDILNDVHNTDLCFVYSQTCLAGHFDGTDCWAEAMNIKIDEGAYAVIMNARYGYGAWESTDGPSQRYDREFWDAVFSPAEGLPELGKANSDSKEDNIYRINEDCMRWCCYELNLFGDPTVAFREMTGMGVSPGKDFEAEGPNGGPFTPGEMAYTLINHDETPITFEVTKSAAWLDLSTEGGTIPGDAEIEVVISINDVANDLPNGHYEDLVQFVNTTNHDGDTARTVALEVGVPVPIYMFSLDTDPGWSTEGQWAFGQPTGGGGEYGGPDPTSGYTGPNVYGYNLNGDYPNNMPERHLTSAAIDCSNLTQVQLKFRRWLGVEQPAYDHAYVRVSADGTSWSEAWTNGSEITDYDWQYQEVDISDVADNQPTVYLRWTMGTTDVGWQYCGWNIDDVEIWGVEPTPECPEDINGDGVVDTEDLLILLGNWGTDGDGDIDGNGVVNTEDLLALLAAWGDCP
jgi:hypothetical protein